jgi:acetolactate synthase-1/2/3 large subunit
MVKHGQRLNQAQEIGVELPGVDYAAMARAVGVKGWLIETWEDFANIDKNELADLQGPVLLDIHIDSEEVPPMKSRIDVLKDASHKVNLSTLDSIR